MNKTVKLAIFLILCLSICTVSVQETAALPVVTTATHIYNMVSTSKDYFKDEDFYDYYMQLPNDDPFKKNILDPVIESFVGDMSIMRSLPLTYEAAKKKYGTQYGGSANNSNVNAVCLAYTYCFGGEEQLADVMKQIGEEAVQGYASLVEDMVTLGGTPMLGGYSFPDECLAEIIEDSTLGSNKILMAWRETDKLSLNDAMKLSIQLGAKHLTLFSNINDSLDYASERFADCKKMSYYKSMRVPVSKSYYESVVVYNGSVFTPASKLDLTMWYSDDPSIAKVYHGRITGVKKGKTKVHFFINNTLKGSVSVTVI